MMLLLRLASLVQVSFLPGYLLLRAAGLRSARPLELAVHSFAVSLLANYVLVFALAASGLYHSTVLYALFAAECAWFAWLHRNVRVSGGLVRDAAGHLRDASWAYGASLAAAALTVLVLAAAAMQNHTAVFTEWDAVVSWNRWAVDWAANALPSRTWRYPQLLPANWSILYVFAQDDVVQAFARILQAVFPLAIALVLLDLGLRERSARLLLAVPLFAIVLARQQPGSISSGYADVPVAFFGFLAVTTALYADDRRERTWWLALLFACGAALTKQAGLYVLVFVWAAALLSVRRAAFAFRSAALVVVLLGSWYMLKEVQIRLGLDRSELAGVFIAAHEGRGVVERLARAAHFLLLGGGLTGTTAALAAAALIASALRDHRQRLIVLGIVAPYLAMWAFLYSYDLRNATLVVPFVALALVHGLPARWDPRPTQLQLVAAGTALVALAGFAVYRDDVFKERQVAARRTIGDARVNEALYGYFGANRMLGKVCTGYQFLGYLPGFQDRIVVKTSPFTLADLEGAERDPAVVYVMDPPEWMTREAWQAIEDRVREGRYRLLFDQPTKWGVFRLVQIRP